MTAITRTINSKGVVIVKRIGKEKGNQKVVCRCPDCGKEFTTWISTFTEILIVADVSILQARGCMKFG